jgi:Fic family protein
MLNKTLLSNFIRESNAIEGIRRDTTKAEISLYEMFLGLNEVYVQDMRNLVAAIQPMAELRNRVGLNVYVGNHIPLAGSPEIKRKLEVILGDARGSVHPWLIHLEYETLHPFTDGNGRSGRALWAWQMIHQHGYDLSLGFLHKYYYQTLEMSRK